MKDLAVYEIGIEQCPSTGAWEVWLGTRTHTHKAAKAWSTEHAARRAAEEWRERVKAKDAELARYWDEQVEVSEALTPLREDGARIQVRGRAVCDGCARRRVLGHVWWPRGGESDLCRECLKRAHESRSKWQPPKAP